MVSAMHPVKLSPFAGSQGPKDRMFRYRLSLSELVITSCDYVIHLGDIFKDFSSQLRNRCTSRQSSLGRFAAGRKVPEQDDDTALPAFCTSVPAGSRFPSRQATLAIFYGTAIGQIEVVQYFCCTPFACGMPLQVFGSHTVDGSGQLVMQIRQFRGHV